MADVEDSQNSGQPQPSWHRAIRYAIAARIKAFPQWIVHALPSAAVGAGVTQVIAVWVQLVGSEPAAVCALAAAALFAIALVRRDFFGVNVVFSGGQKATQPERSAVISVVSMTVGAGVALSMVPTLLEFGLQLSTRLFPGQPAFAFLPAAAVAAMVLGSILYWASQLYRVSPSSTAPYDSVGGLIGVTATLMIHSSTATSLSWSSTAWMAAASLLTLFAKFPPPVDERRPETLPRPAFESSAMLRGIQALITGFTLVVVLSVFGLLFPLSLQTLLPMAAGLTVALSAMSRFSEWARVPFGLASAAGIGAVVVLSICFRQMTDSLLYLQAVNLGIWGRVLLQCWLVVLVGSICSLPLMILLRRSGNHDTTEEQGPSAASRSTRIRTAHSAPWFVGGLLAGTMSSAFPIPVTHLLIACGILNAASGFHLLLNHWRLQDRQANPGPAESHFRPFGLPHGLLWLQIAIIGLLPMGLVGTTIDPGRAARLLFTPRAIVGLRRGLEPDMLLQSDAVRELETVETHHGTVTIWRERGDILSFRRNGIPLGAVTANPEQTPQPIQEVLPAVLPLVMHELPNEVTVLGDDTGTCLRVCANFPIRRLIAWRSDPVMTAVAERYVWSDLMISPLKDPRTDIRHDSGVMAVRRLSEQPSDVLIVAGMNPATLSGAAQFSREFYDFARQGLRPNGILCQRIRRQDLGVRAVEAILSSAADVFESVGAFRIAPGELALIATDREAGLVDDEILTRLQRAHVQREISRAGWDWAQVASLPYLDVRDPIGPYSEGMPGRGVSTATAYSVLHFPTEALRWADKAYEFAAGYGPYEVLISERVSSGPAHQELKKRITSMKQQVEILSGFPDEPWAYRRSLKSDMERNPRPAVQDLTGPKLVRRKNPLDEQRESYFLTLGQAVRGVFGEAESRQLMLDNIDDLRRFTQLNEPLMSHFAYHELIRLHDLASHPNQQQQFSDRLHVVYFSTPDDYSVRQVTAALDQVVKSPTVISVPEERFHHVNSLLQELVLRWERRTEFQPRSALRVQSDIDHTITVTGRALSLMESLCDETSATSEEVILRRRFINGALIQPLREYREQIVAHRLKHADPADAGGDADPDDRPLLLDPSEWMTN